MSSIRIYFYHGFQRNSRLAPLETAIRLGDTGRILVVDKMRDSNLILCTQCDSEVFDHVHKYPEKFILLLDQTESVNCQGWTLNFLDYDEVLAVFKPTVFREVVPGEHFKTVRKRHHFALLDPKAEAEVLTVSANRKVFCVPWSIGTISLGSTKPPVPWTDRPIDVLVAVPRKATDPVLAAHQQQAKQKVLTLREKGFAVLTETEPATLRQWLRKSKVVVSPFGRGEITPADSWAVAEECVLVKPACGYVRAFPDLMRENTVNFCAVDLGDLDKVVLGILREPQAARRKTLVAKKMLCREEDYLLHFQKSLVRVWDQMEELND